MNLFKTTALSVLVCVSAVAYASEQKSAGHIEFNFSYTQIASEITQEHITPCGNYKVEFAKGSEENTVLVSVYKKDETGEWTLIAQPTISVTDNEHALLTFAEENKEEADSLSLKININK